MLNKEQILDKLTKLNFPKEKYCVMTGAALVMYGVRSETADIDLGCTSELFEELLQKGFEIAPGKPYKGIIIDGCIEIFENWMPSCIVMLHGIPTADMMDIRRYKEQLGREKDLRDIKLIDQFLEKTRKA